MPLSPNKINRLKRIAAMSSITLAIFLCVLKSFAVFYTSSLAVLSSLVDNLSDVFASLVTFFAVKISVKPASSNYRYGYGKVESLSALFQSLFVAVSGLYILYDGCVRFFNPVNVEQTGFGLLVMAISLVSTLCLVLFQKYIAKVTNSKAIAADALHYSVDIFANLSVMVSLFFTRFLGIIQVDTIMAVFISFYLLYNAFEFGKEAIGLLLDKELNDDVRNKVLDIVKTHPMNPEAHDLRTRDLGGCYMFEFHLEFEGGLTLKAVHNYTSEIESLIRNEYPNAQIIIHQEPVGLEEERLDNRLK